MESNNQKRIIFDSKQSPGDIIEGILKNNGLEETSEEYLKKIEQKNDPWLDIIYRLSKKLAAGEITETIFIADIQKRLNISGEIAKNILKEAKEKLLSYAKVIKEDELEEKYEIETPIKIQRPVELNTSPMLKTNKKIVKNFAKGEKSNTSNDAYREPIG